MRANLAQALHDKYGTPLPYGQQHVEPETAAQAVSALSDPAGLGASALQGLTIGGAGYLSPAIKQRAESYTGMHPTAGRLGYMAGGAAPAIITGGAADLAAAPLAARPLLQALVRYAPSTVLGGAQGYFGSPDDAPLGARLINMGLGGLTGGGGQAMSDMGGNVVNRLETGRMPAWKPVATPLALGAGKTALVGGGGYLAHQLLPKGIADLATEASPLALVLSPGAREAVFGGPKEMWTGIKNLASNLYGSLSTPKGPARVAGRFAPGAYPPARSAIPAALAAPYLAGATTPSWLAQIYAQHHYDPANPPRYDPGF
jgi:hypothetical protein